MMPDGSPQEGEPHFVDLSAQDFSILLTDEAIRYASSVNFYKDGRIALHIKYVQLRGGLVLSDMRDGVWGEDRFVECPRPSGGGIRATLALREGVPHLEVMGAAALSLAERFDLVGKLTARLPPVVRLAAPRGTQAAASSQIVQMRTVEEAGLGLGIDATITAGGAFYIEGWVDDRGSPLVGLSLVDFATGNRKHLPAYRVRRPDVEGHLQASRPREFGFWTAAPGGGDQLDAAAVSLVFEDGSGIPLALGKASRQGQQDFFEFLLASFGRRNVLGNLAARSFADLEAGHGELLGKLYRQIRSTRTVTLSASLGSDRSPIISLVCVLYGIPDFLYMLVAQFARFSPLDGMEFVFVNNSPEIEEALLRDAELANLVFGASVRVVSLNQNCGFSHANNIGVSEARGRTIAIINPDVFPRDAAAVAHLLALAETGLGNDMRGGKLYYADGSVMHEGMYFERDRKLSALCNAPIWTVEHFRKGFADTASSETRAVPAITGALMVLDRRLYERMGGFNTDIIFGHYEDADLCLRIQEADGRVMLDPALAYWHYEGMGSVKRPEHVGSNMYNRWYFSRRWGGRLDGTTDA